MINKLLPQAAKAPIQRLLRRGSPVASQAGQDRWIYGEAFNEKKRGFFLDIGAHDGVWLSNTYVLESKYDWSGICIEANPTTFLALEKNRRVTCVNACLDRSEGEVDFVSRGVFGGIVGTGLDNDGAVAEPGELVRLRTMPLIDVLEARHAPRIVDYLSIDIEGAEERVLADFPFDEYTFRCITIERPSERLRDLLKRAAYVLIKEIPGLDCFYIHESFSRSYKKNLFAFYRNERQASGTRWSKSANI